MLSLPVSQLTARICSTDSACPPSPQDSPIDTNNLSSQIQPLLAPGLGVVRSAQAIKAIGQGTPTTTTEVRIWVQ